MLNAKETLKKLADALSITSEETAEVKEETSVEAVESETKEEVETSEEPKEEVVEAIQEVKEEPKEEVQAEEEKETEVADTRVQELEDKVKQLTEILKNALSEPEAPVVPEVPEDSKGLTHSPESIIHKQHTKLGGKGDNVMSRVYKYINH